MSWFEAAVWNLRAASRRRRLGACAQSQVEKQNLALYCQVKSCLCIPQVRNPFSKNEPVALLWRDNGDAYCPKDYKLDPAEKPKEFKSRYGG